MIHMEAVQYIGPKTLCLAMFTNGMACCCPCDTKTVPVWVVGAPPPDGQPGGQNAPGAMQMQQVAYAQEAPGRNLIASRGFPTSSNRRCCGDCALSTAPSSLRRGALAARGDESVRGRESDVWVVTHRGVQGGQREGLANDTPGACAQAEERCDER